MWQMIDLMKIHNISKSDQYSICGRQVLSFQIFSYQFSIHENNLFFFFSFFFGFGGGGLGPNSPKYYLILLMFALELVFMEKKKKMF